MGLVNAAVKDADLDPLTRASGGPPSRSMRRARLIPRWHGSGSCDIASWRPRPLRRQSLSSAKLILWGRTKIQLRPVLTRTRGLSRREMSSDRTAFRCFAICLWYAVASARRIDSRETKRSETGASSRIKRIASGRRSEPATTGLPLARTGSEFFGPTACTWRHGGQRSRILFVGRWGEVVVFLPSGWDFRYRIGGLSGH